MQSEEHTSSDMTSSKRFVAPADSQQGAVQTVQCLAYSAYVICSAQMFEVHAVVLSISQRKVLSSDCCSVKASHPSAEAKQPMRPPKLGLKPSQQQQ